MKEDLLLPVEAVQRLFAAVVRQACVDFYKCCDYKGKNHDTIELRDSTRAFFHSKRFDVFCKRGDGEEIAALIERRKKDGIPLFRGGGQQSISQAKSWR